MKRKLIAVLIGNLFVAAPMALAAEGDFLSGSVGIGYRHTNENAKDPSKLNEYRDLDSSFIGIFDLRGRGEQFYFNGFGENLGRDDQYIDLNGGQYGIFKYKLYDNELRHNFGSGVGAISPYSGLGTSVLTATFPSINPATWNNFDNSYTRKDLGGMVEISANSPFYFRVDANEIRREGIKNISGAQGTSPGNGFIELPSPIDYRTRNVSVEGGYQSRQAHVAVSWMQSKFDNGNELLRWSNGFYAPGIPGSYDTTVLPPDNDYSRFSVNGNLRQLPWGTTLAGRYTYSKLTNDVAIQETMLAAGNTFPTTNASVPNFNGNVKDETASLSLTSHPTNALDTRLYWNWFDRKNHSTDVVFSPSSTSGLLCSGAPCEPELFSLEKHNGGFEADYRVNPQNRVSAGIDYTKADRERIDFVSNKDRKYFLQWKSSAFDVVDARLKYQFLQRRSDYVPSTGIDSYVRRFDLANVDQNLVKLVVDYSPAPLFDLGMEAIWKHNDYKDTILGRTKDERQELYLSAAFGDIKSFRFIVFGDIEFMQYDSLHRVGSGDPNPEAPPSGNPNSTTYTWSANNHDKSWQVGIAAEWIPADQWAVKASLIWDKTRGNADFSVQPGTVLAAPLLPIDNFDNTTRTSFNLKGTYALNKNWAFTGGYAYERYRYSDIGFDCPDPPIASQPSCPYVVNTIPPGGAATAYLTGQTAFQNYNVNIVYLIAMYRF